MEILPPGAAPDTQLWFGLQQFCSAPVPALVPLPHYDSRRASTPYHHQRQIHQSSSLASSSSSIDYTRRREESIDGGADRLYRALPSLMDPIGGGGGWLSNRLSGINTEFRGPPPQQQQQQQSQRLVASPTRDGQKNTKIAADKHSDSQTPVYSDQQSKQYKVDAPKADCDQTSAPRELHRFNHHRSILAVEVTGDYLFAATEGGEILVYSLSSYELVKAIDAHNGSVLGLCASEEENLLFSSAGDRFVNVWDTQTLRLIATIYSVYDVGDIFCVSYSQLLKTVYLGSQNTSIQWFDLKNLSTLPPPDLSSHPYVRTDKFFDSPGPGGTVTPRRYSTDQHILHARKGRDWEINRNNIHQFAHYGYVYCTLIVQDPRFGAGDCEILISGGGDGTIKLWTLDEADQGRIKAFTTLEDTREGGESILSIVLDGTFLYSGRVDGEINVWDLETKQLLRALKAHDSDVLTLAVGDRFVFSADVNGVSKKFDQRHECVGEWKAHEGITLASKYLESQTGALYITGGNDDTLAIWDMTDTQKTSKSLKKPDNDQMIEVLRDFISFRSVSSDPRYQADCRRAASFLRGKFKELGASTELISTDNGYNPIVCAKFSSNQQQSPLESRKRILFYGHYDVVAAENKQEKWRTDPFSLEGRDGYLYGRGISDNKGPVLAAAYAATEVLARGKLNADVIFLIEGEEESGSRGFQAAVKKNKDLIGPVDWILLANSYWLDDEVPCLTYGLRGVIHASIEIRSQEPDLHSGVDGSMLLDEPLKDLITVLSRLSGQHGRILLPGFYDSIPPVTRDEKLFYDEIARTLLERNPELGRMEDLANSLLQRWRNPTLTVHGFSTSGSETSTIIPHKATAALSLRIVPNQAVEVVAKDLVQFLNKQFDQLESKNSIAVTITHKAEPWLGDYTNDLFKTLERAIMDVWSQGSAGRTRRTSSTARANSLSNQTGGKRPTTAGSASKAYVATSSTLANSTAILDYEEGLSPNSPPPDGLLKNARKPLYIREGGSIPAIRFLEKEFNAPAAHLPCGQASDNAHLDNERLRIVNLWNSKEIFKRLFVWLSE